MWTFKVHCNWSANSRCAWNTRNVFLVKAAICANQVAIWFPNGLNTVGLFFKRVYGLDFFNSWYLNRLSWAKSGGTFIAKSTRRCNKFQARLSTFPFSPSELLALLRLVKRIRKRGKRKRERQRWFTYSVHILEKENCRSSFRNLKHIRCRGFAKNWISRSNILCEYSPPKSHPLRVDWDSVRFYSRMDFGRVIYIAVFTGWKWAWPAVRGYRLKNKVEIFARSHHIWEWSQRLPEKFTRNLQQLFLYFRILANSLDGCGNFIVHQWHPANMTKSLWTHEVQLPRLVTP